MQRFRWVSGSPIFHFETVFSKRFDFKNQSIFSYGRHALIAALKYLQKTRNLLNRDLVLVPSFMCHEVVEALRGAGFSVAYYRLDSSFEVDQTSLASVLGANAGPTGRALSVLVFQPYGRRVRNLDCVQNLCDEYGLPVIEDCAHVPYPYIIESGLKPLARIYTLRKLYALPYGAVVEFGDEADRFLDEISAIYPEIGDPESLRIPIWALKQTAKRFFIGAGIKISRQYRDLSSDPLKTFNRARSLVEAFVHASEPERSVRVRRTNLDEYRSRSNLFEGWAQVVDFDRTTDIPYQYPLILRKDLSPEKMAERFLRVGIGAVVGLALPEEVKASLPVDHEFLRLLSLPIHQDVSHKQLCHIFEFLNSIRDEVL